MPSLLVKHTFNSYLKSLPIGFKAFGSLSSLLSTVSCFTGLSYLYFVAITGFSQIFLDNYSDDIKWKKESVINKLVRSDY